MINQNKTVKALDSSHESLCKSFRKKKELILSFRKGLAIHQWRHGGKSFNLPVLRHPPGGSEDVSWTANQATAHSGKEGTTATTFLDCETK